MKNFFFYGRFALACLFWGLVAAPLLFVVGLLGGVDFNGVARSLKL